MLNIIINHYECHCERPPKDDLVMGFKFGLTEPKERKPMPVEKTILNTEKVRATLNITTKSGKPAPVDGEPSWEKVSGEGGLVVADDGMSAELISTDLPGETVYLVKADADLDGTKVREIADTIKIITKGEEAENLGLTLGNPEPK